MYALRYLLMCETMAVKISSQAFGGDTPGLDNNFLHHFPLCRVGFKIYFLSQDSTSIIDLFWHHSCLPE